MSEKVKKIRFIIIIGISLFIGGFIMIYENNSRIVLDRKYDYLDQIVIDADLSNVVVKYIGSNDINVVIYGKDKDIIKVDEGNTDIIINKQSSREFCLFNCEDKIILYLPKYFKKLDVRTDLGNVDTSEVNLEELYVYSEAGNINAGLVNKAIIYSEIGNTTINEIDGKEDSSISSNTGNITINKINNLNVDAKSNVGKVEINKSNDEMNEFNLKISTEVGNIKVR